MEVWKAISTNRAVRRFSDRPIEPERLDRVLESARRAPSSKNGQRWSFIAVTDRERLRALSGAGNYADHIAGAAAAIAIVVPASDVDWEREYIAFDSGQAARNMMLAAWELGIGSCHASVYDEEMARELLGYPVSLKCDLLISFGYPADPSDLTRPRAKGARRPFGEVVHRELW